MGKGRRSDWLAGWEAFVGFLALLGEEPRKSEQTNWVQRFFPYLLLRRRYAATQSPAGVTMAFRGELNRAVPCATNTGAFFTGPCTGRHTLGLALVLFPRASLALPRTHARTQGRTLAHASSCSILSRHTAGVRRRSAMAKAWAGLTG